MSLPGVLRGLALAALLLGCKERASARRAPVDDAAVVAAPVATAPLGPVRAGPARVTYLVYVAGDGDLRAAVEAALAPETGLRRADAPGSEGPLPAVIVVEPPMDAVPVPEPELLPHFSVDLSPAEVAQVAASKRAVAITVEYTAETALAELARGQRIAAAAARALRGLVWIEETRLLYGQKAWAERGTELAKPHPLATPLTNVHAYQPGDDPLVRLVSLGMGSLGLPDLVVDDVPAGFQDEARGLFAVVAEQLLQGATPDASGDLEVRLAALTDDDGKPLEPPGEGATGVATVRLVTAKPEDGDPDNRLWAITFPGDGPLAERQAAVLQALFGRTSEVKGVATDDPEIAAVTAKVQKGLPALKKSFAKRQSVEHLQVKAGFATPDGNREYMWVDVQSWKGKTLRGVLMNEPMEAELVMGAPVDVDDGAIVDYMFHRADGSTEGGESNAILERRQRLDAE